MPEHESDGNPRDGPFILQPFHGAAEVIGRQSCCRERKKRLDN